MQKNKLQYGLNVFFTDKDVPDVSAYARVAPSVRHIVVPPNAAHETVTIDIALDTSFRSDELVIEAGEGSDITVIERVRSVVPGAIRVSKVRVIAAANARVTHVGVQDIEEDAAEFVTRVAEVGKDASVIWLASVTGGAFTQNHARTELVGEGASVKSRTLFFGGRTQKFDLYAEAEHLAPRTHADLAGRGALMDASKAVARGLVRIPHGSAKSVAREREDVLVFGPKAEADVIPNLEIEEGDVRCSHGAAIGRLDENRLFYLMSRGLTRAAALQFAVEGFFAPMLEDMRDEGLRDTVQCLLAEKVASAFANMAKNR